MSLRFTDQQTDTVLRQTRPGPSSRVRRSAVKARKSFATQSPSDSLAQSTKTIQSVKRHRKQRHIKLKELAKDDEETNSRDSWLGRFTGEEITCPVCSINVRGDQDVLDAHVDACLAHESQRLEMARRQGSEEETWEGGNDGNYVGDIRGNLPLHSDFNARAHCILQAPAL